LPISTSFSRSVNLRLGLSETYTELGAAKRQLDLLACVEGLQERIRFFARRSRIDEPSPIQKELIISDAFAGRLNPFSWD
jgi:hypothetical protein